MHPGYQRDREGSGWGVGGDAFSDMIQVFACHSLFKVCHGCAALCS